jgi:hypothetical protein
MCFIFVQRAENWWSMENYTFVSIFQINNQQKTLSNVLMFTSLHNAISETSPWSTPFDLLVLPLSLSIAPHPSQSQAFDVQIAPNGSRPQSQLSNCQAIKHRDDHLINVSFNLKRTHNITKTKFLPALIMGSIVKICPACIVPLALFFA